MRQEGFVVTSTAPLTASSSGCLVADVFLVLPMGRSFPQIPALRFSRGVCCSPYPRHKGLCSAVLPLGEQQLLGKGPEVVLR